MLTLQLLALLLVASAIQAEKCPQRFLRLSAQPSYCLPPNSQCQILWKGITKEDKALILAEHNALRSKLANGLETQGGGLPASSNMIEMVWDDTLQHIAQKWVNQCNFNHDCGPCRSVPDYSVGQNLGQGPASCQTPNCGQESWSTLKPDWKSIVDMWYNEVRFVNPGLISNYVFDESWGHFSQVAWAKSWRVGCGYAVYIGSDGQSLEQLYGCNYGEAGNWDNQPIYDSGSACSNCPVESTCTSQGLCKLNNPKKAPVWQSELDAQSAYIFNCDFSDNNPDCDSYTSGNNNWYYSPRITGTVLGAVFQAGQSSTLTFTKKIKPTTPFCMVFVERNGANTFGQQVAGKVSTNIQQPPSMPSWVVDLTMGGPDFTPMSLTMYQADTTFTITVSVPNGAPDQYVEFQKIYAYPGNCKS